MLLDISNHRHQSVLSRCGVGRRHGMLRGNCDVAAQRDAVVGILGSGEQSICWRRLRVVQGDHVACDGGRVDGCRGIRYVRRRWPRQPSRIPEPRSVRQSRWRAREGCRLIRGLDRWWCRARPAAKDRSPGLLSEVPALASTGSVVSTTGAAFARASLATLPGCATSPVAPLPVAGLARRLQGLAPNCQACERRRYPMQPLATTWSTGWLHRS